MGSKQNTSELHTIISGLMRQLESKDHMIEHLLEKVDSLEKTIKGQSRDIQKMAGIISTYERRLFGTRVRKPIETRLKRLLKRTILRRMTRIAIRKAALMMLKAIVLPRLLKISNSIYLQGRKRDMYTRAKEITATLSVMK